MNWGLPKDKADDREKRGIFEKRYCASASAAATPFPSAWCICRTKSSQRVCAPLLRRPGPTGSPIRLRKNQGNPGGPHCALTIWCTNIRFEASLDRNPDSCSQTSGRSWQTLLCTQNSVHSKSRCAQGGRRTGRDPEKRL